MVIGAKKNVCQNPKCCENSTKDRYNKKLEDSYYRYCKYFVYFCTTRCLNEWVNDNIENIIERGHAPKKITEKIIRQSQ